ncbi:MAG: response regulator [Verrucomicrobiota bacterium]|nr:response regulator [Verrucomicrobiota bacterium]
MNGTILVVDDDRSVRESLSRALQAEGYRIILAENGQTAIGKLEVERIDLLLLDLGLPVKDGWAMLDRLAETEPLLPVVVITGHWEQAMRAASCRVDVLMEKPLNVPALFQIIRELLQEPHEARARRIHDHGPGFRHVPCDIKEFCEQLRKAYATPYPGCETDGLE